MRTLYCEECNKTITDEEYGLKYNGLYFCSMECIDDYINWYIDAITGEDFERDGVDYEETDSKQDGEEDEEDEGDEEDEEDDEIVND